MVLFGKRGLSTDAQAVALVRAELPRVERLISSMLGPRQDLEDLVQTVFSEACRAFAHYRAEGSPGAFVSGIAVRVARRAMRRPAFLRHRADFDEERTAGDHDPESEAARAQTAVLLRAALDALAPKKRVAFTLWAIEGMDVAEIAALTGASVPATRSRIFYAQRELRAWAERHPALRVALGATQ